MDISKATHDRGLFTADGHIECDCGEVCADRTTWHRHTAETYNNPSKRAIWSRGGIVHSAIEEVEPQTGYELYRCRKLACADIANGVDCWVLMPPRSSTLFGLPSEAAAKDLMSRGGIVAATYTYPFC